MARRLCRLFCLLPANFRILLRVRAYDTQVTTCTPAVQPGFNVGMHGAPRRGGGYTPTLSVE